jgi:hypothetical protein
MWASFNRFEIKMTLAQAQEMSHQGQCDEDVAHGRAIPAIKKQLDKLNPEALRAELKEYGAWDANDLSDHDANLNRILWIAAGNFVEEHHERKRKTR